MDNFEYRTIVGASNQIDTAVKELDAQVQALVDMQEGWQLQGHIAIASNSHMHSMGSRNIMVAQTMVRPRPAKVAEVTVPVPEY